MSRRLPAAPLISASCGSPNGRSALAFRSLDREDVDLSALLLIAGRYFLCLPANTGEANEFVQRALLSLAHWLLWAAERLIAGGKN